MKEISVTLCPRELELIKKSLDATGSTLSYLASSNLDLWEEYWRLRERFEKLIAANR